MADRIERAREHGDLKENAEYHAAKEEESKMEARVAQLFGILDDPIIVELGDSNVVGVGTIVGIKYEGDSDDEVEKYLVGSIEERRDDLTVVSPTSPLGEKLLGASPGDRVSYDSPGGELTVEILNIE